jgi:ribosomal protein L17
MRHLKKHKFKQFKLINLARSLLLNNAIVTSKKNAKNLLSFVEKLITTCIKYHGAKNNNSKFIKIIVSKLQSKFVSFLLIHVLSKNFLKFKGGHVRIIKLPSNSNRNCLVSFIFDFER